MIVLRRQIELPSKQLKAWPGEMIPAGYGNRNQSFERLSYGL